MINTKSKRIALFTEHHKSMTENYYSGHYEDNNEKVRYDIGGKSRNSDRINWDFLT